MTRIKLERLIIISLLCLGVIAATLVTVISYANYCSYFKSMQNNEGPISSEVSDPVLKEITVSIAEGKGFYQNGKASPIKSDLLVEGVYEISETESYKDVISSDDFTMEFPEDFSENGGEIIVKYKEMIATLKVTLTPVALQTLYTVENPYIVAYKVGDYFSTAGMVLQAKYNDGTIIEVGNNYEVLTTEPLSESLEYAQIRFTKDEKILTCNIPISVKTPSEFTSGELVSISVEGETTVSEGQSLQNSVIQLRGLYSNGNRILIDGSKYQIKNGETIAKLGGRYSLQIASIENSELEYEFPVNVIKRTQAEDATLVGGLIFNGSEYIKGESGFINNGSLTYVGAFQNAVNGGGDGYLEITISSETNCRGDVNIRVANCFITKDGNIYKLNELSLNSLMRLLVNGAEKSISKDVLLNVIAESSDVNEINNIYQEIRLRNINILKGINVIRLDFKQIAENISDYEGVKPSTLNIDWLEVITNNSEIELSLGEYASICSERDVAPSFASTLVNRRIVLDNYSTIQGACSDGKYIYYAFTDSNNHEGRIAKFDPKTNSVIEKSEMFILNERTDWFYDSANLVYINGEILIIKSDGSILSFDANTLSAKVGSSYNFSGLEGKTIVSIYYNSLLKLYAVCAKEANWNAWGHMYIFDENFNILVNDIRVSTKEDVKWGGYALRNLYGNNDYIYAIFGEEKTHQAIIKVFDWSANVLNEVTINGFNPTSTERVSVKNLVELNGKCYIGVYDFSGQNGGYIYETTFNLTDVIKTDVQEPETEKIELLQQGLIKADSTYSFMMGACTDGQFVYYAFNDSCNYKCKIIKYNLSTKAIVGTSSEIQLKESNTWGVDNANLSYINGKIALIKDDGTAIFINATDLQIINDQSLIFSNPYKINDVCYNSTLKKYAVVARKGQYDVKAYLYFYDEEFNLLTTEPIEICTENQYASWSGSFHKYQTMFNGGDYLYSVHGSDGTHKGCIIKWDWNGNKISEKVLDGNFGVESSTKNNVQNMVIVNGVMYIGVLDFTGPNGGYIYKCNFTI